MGEVGLNYGETVRAELDVRVAGIRVGDPDQVRARFNRFDDYEKVGQLRFVVLWAGASA